MFHKCDMCDISAPAKINLETENLMKWDNIYYNLPTEKLKTVLVLQLYFVESIVSIR